MIDQEFERSAEDEAVRLRVMNDTLAMCFGGHQPPGAYLSEFWPELYAGPDDVEDDDETEFEK